MRTLPFLILGMLSVGSANAQPVQYSIPWFEADAHNGARQEMIKLCRNDHRYYENPQTRPLCDNAETAESRRYSKTINQGLNSVNTVEWWKNNRDLRFSTLQACQRRAPYDRDLLKYCNVAREAEQLMAPLAKRARG